MDLYVRNISHPMETEIPFTASNSHNILVVYAVPGYFTIDLILTFWCQPCEGMLNHCQMKYGPL